MRRLYEQSGGLMSDSSVVMRRVSAGGGVQRRDYINCGDFTGLNAIILSTTYKTYQGAVEVDFSAGIWKNCQQTCLEGAYAERKFLARPS
jgi:hypothetical protein